MHFVKNFLIWSLLFTGINLSAQEIPVVSLNKLGATVSAETEKDHLEKNAKVEAAIVWASPGVNQILPLAIQHLNRIVTPFHDPEITTVSAVTTQIRKNVIYVGTANETPVSLYITEKGEEGAALSFTVLPQRIPPREITIKLTNQVKSLPSTIGKETKRWEQSQPYVSTLRTLLRQLAKGELPQGYTFTEDNVGTALATCQQTGLQFDFSQDQQLVGHHLAVRIGLAKNISKKSIEFNEYSCANWQTAAVAAWPKNVLLPEESTEIFIVQKQSKSQNQPVKRPSLIRDVP